MRRNRQLPERLNDRRRDRVVTAARAERRDRALVVATRQADRVLLERWMMDETKEGDELYPAVKNAWRPFGLGPRSCIGQELAVAEMKMVLVLVVRQWEVRCAWDEWETAK